MTRKLRILVVEDEQAIRVGLVDLLVFHGYEVDAISDGKTGLERALTGQYDLILLDIMLPRMDGYEICNRLRETDREQPIIMLTAKSDDEDIIHGLRLGADDYVAKPFSVTQLILRIQAVLRRARAGLDSHIIEIGELQVDTRSLVGKKIGKKVGEETGEQIPFTRREMDILEYLAQNQERPIPREELLSKVWGYAKDLALETRTVDIHIAKIRRKIEPNPAEPRFLITVRMAGYQLKLH